MVHKKLKPPIVPDKGSKESINGKIDRLFQVTENFDQEMLGRDVKETFQQPDFSQRSGESIMTHRVDETRGAGFSQFTHHGDDLVSNSCG